MGDNSNNEIDNLKKEIKELKLLNNSLIFDNKKIKEEKEELNKNLQDIKKSGDKIIKKFKRLKTDK